MGLTEKLGFSLEADLRPFVSKLGDVTREVGVASANMGRRFASVTDELGRALGKAGLVAGALAGAATKGAMSFEAAMARARTMSDLTNVEWEQLTANVKEATSTFGVTDFAQVGEAVFQAFSTGSSTVEEATEAVTVAFKNWRAQGTEVGTTLGFVAQQQALFGDAAGSSADILDRLANATIKAQSDQERMARAMAETGQLAKAAGLSADELAATMATLTQSTGSAERAATAFKGLLNAILTPTAAQAATIEDVNAGIIAQVGDLDAAVGVWGSLEGALKASNLELVTFGAQAVEAKGGFFPFIEDLATAMGRTDVNTRRVAESMEGYSALLALTGDAGQSLGENLGFIASESGRLDKQLGFMMNTADTMWDQALVDLKLFGVELVTGSGFLEDMKVVLTGASQALRSVTESVREWMENNPDALAEIKAGIVEWGKLLGGLWAVAKAVGILTTGWGLLSGALGIFKPLLPALGKLWTAALLPAIKVVGGALLGFLGPVGAVIAGVVAIGAAVLAFVVDWDAAWKAAGEILDEAIGFLSWLWDGFVEVLSVTGNAILDAITWPFRAGAELVVDIWTGVVDWFSGIGASISDFFGFNGGGLVQPVPGFAGGGWVPGSNVSAGDTVPAMLTPGEFVIREPSARVLGPEFLEAANAAADTGRAPGGTGGGVHIHGAIVDSRWWREVALPMLEYQTERRVGPRERSVL